MKICIDVTEMLKTNYISGIQRVVKEVTIRWLERGWELLLLSYDLERKCFYLVDNEKYYNFYSGRSNEKEVLSDVFMRIGDFQKGYIFYDLDSAWNYPLKRSWLLPQLKKQGAKIAAHIYDTIPITETQFCHSDTVLNFMEWFGAQLKYADLIITNAQATVCSIEKIIEGTKIKRLNAKIVRLGCDLRKDQVAPVYQNNLAQLAHIGKYVLMVGTIEPRKNHEYILNAFDQKLFAQGLHLVLAGRIGWNVEGLVQRIKKHPELGKKLFLIEDASDEDIAYLYKNALAVAFPSYNEGYGLPVIEALYHKAIVLAADIPVLREVGGELCRYFSLESVEAFIDLASFYSNNQEACEEQKKKLESFRVYTWEDCAKTMYQALKLHHFKWYDRISNILKFD